MSRKKKPRRVCIKCSLREVRTSQVCFRCRRKFGMECPPVKLACPALGRGDALKLQPSGIVLGAKGYEETPGNEAIIRAHRTRIYEEQWAELGVIDYSDQRLFDIELPETEEQEEEMTEALSA